MALTDLTRISTSGIATGTSLSGAILHGDAHFRGPQVGVTSALFDSSENELNFKDNVKLTFGDKTNGDLQVYHNGSDNYIDAITGSLYFRNTLPTNTIFQTGNFLIKNQKSAETLAKLHPLKRLGEGNDAASLAKLLEDQFKQRGQQFKNTIADGFD